MKYLRIYKFLWKIQDLMTEFGWNVNYFPPWIVALSFDNSVLISALQPIIHNR